MPALPAIELWQAFWVGSAAGFVAGMLVFSLMVMNHDHGQNQDS